MTLPGGSGPTGVAVDSNGKVWVANLLHQQRPAHRPDRGPDRRRRLPDRRGGPDGRPRRGRRTLQLQRHDRGRCSARSRRPWAPGASCRTAERPAGRGAPSRWNTEPQGSTPAGTSITVEARAADTEAGLAAQPFTPVSNNVQFGLVGRYIEARATLRAAPSGASPVLSDLRITAAERDGVFSCQATVLRIAGLTSTVANPQDVPCVDDHANLAQVQLNAGLVTVRANALDATTDQVPDDLFTLPAAGDHSTATAKVETTRITVGALVTIELGVVKSTATVTCVPGPRGGLVPSFTGSSQIASLKINGLPVTVGTTPLTIPLIVGSLRLNSTTTTTTSVTQHAVILDTVLTDVVVGEAKANVEPKPGNPLGHPCQV